MPKPFPKTSVKKQFFVFSMISVMLTACGGGTSADTNTSSSPSTSALTLSRSTPANGSAGMSRDLTAQLEFSAALDSATATAASVTLTYNGGSAPLSMTASGAQLTVTSTQRLLPLTPYSLQIGTALSGANGQKLSNPVVLNFTTEDRIWTDHRLLETRNDNTTEPRIAIDGNGRALAVWLQQDGIHASLWSSRYTPTAGWSAAQLVETDHTGSINIQQLAMDASGNALAVWTQWDGARDNLWANRYTSASGWGTPELLENDNGGVIALEVATSSGNGMAVWAQHDGTTSNIWGRPFSVAAGWGMAQLIENNNTPANEPQIVLGNDGNGVAVWRQSDGTSDSIWANRYTAGVGWGIAEQIEANNLPISGTPPRLAIDGNGNVLVIWRHSDGTRGNIWSNRYAVGSGWDVPQLIETENGETWAERLAVDANGNGIAVWQQFDGTRFNIWSNRYTVGSGWETAQVIETENNDASAPQIALDASGNGIAAWPQFDGTRYNLVFNRYVVGSGWSGPKLVEPDSANHALNARLAIESGGKGILAWRQHDGTSFNIRSSRFD
jgi:hypothetical protein